MDLEVATGRRSHLARPQKEGGSSARSRRARRGSILRCKSVCLAGHERMERLEPEVRAHDLPRLRPVSKKGPRFPPLHVACGEGGDELPPAVRPRWRSAGK